MKIASCFPILVAFTVSTVLHGQVLVKAGTELAASPSTQVAVKDADVRILSSRVDLQDADLFLSGTASNDLSTGATATTPTVLHGIIVDGGGEYNLFGAWKISDLLTFTSGRLIITGTGNELTYAGADDLIGTDASFIQGPLYIEGAGTRTFPIGLPGGYFPVRLDNMVATPLGFEVIAADPNISTLPPGVTDILRDRHWQLLSRGASFSDSRLAVSAKQLETFVNSVPTGSPTLLEVGVDGIAIDLEGISTISIDFLTGTKNATASGDRYAIGKKDELIPLIGEVLTPNSDGKNNVLIISNIEFFPVNTVTLMDRYSAIVHTWSNFKNYGTADANQEFDFTSLAIGNYLCVVQYTDAGGNQKSATQMITVLK